MESFVIYQTNKKIGIVEAQLRNLFVYERELKPFRFWVINATKEGIEAIRELESDSLIDILNTELNNKENFIFYQN